MAGKEFGERLRRAMEARGYTNRTFAPLVAVKEETVSRWVNGKVAPRYEELVRIVGALDIDADYLLFEGREMVPLDPGEAVKQLRLVRALAKQLQEAAAEPLPTPAVPATGPMYTYTVTEGEGSAARNHAGGTAADVPSSASDLPADPVEPEPVRPAKKARGRRTRGE